MMVLQLIADGLLILALAGAGYTLAAAVAVKPQPEGDRGAGSSRDVTLLKPLCGEAAGLADDLESFLVQDYGGAVQMVAGVQDPADPARGVVAGLQASHPDADIELVVDSRQHGSNRKVSNLLNMIGRARHELIVLSDADIRAGPGYLAAISTAAAQPGVGAVTCRYFGRARAGAWSRLAAMGVSYGFLPNVTLGIALGLAKPCMGSTIALRREVLAQIGGLEAVKDVLMDDYEIGRLVRDRGYTVAIPPVLVAHSCTEASWRELFAHEVRWAATIRAIDPAGHAGSLVTHPVPLALIGLALAGGAPWSLVVLALALAARLYLKARVDRAAGERSGPWWLLPARDVLSFAVFAASLFADTVYWRGARFGVSSRRKFFPA